MAFGQTVTVNRTPDKAVKFLFERDFDEPVVEIDPSAPEAPCGRTNAELDQLLAEAHEAGREQAAEEARVAAEASIAQVVDGLAEGVQTLIADRLALQQQLTREAAQLAHAIALKLTPRLMKAHPLAEIERLTEDCLRELGDEPRLVIRLHEAMLPQMKARIDGLARAAGYDGAVVLLGDDGMSPLDCRIDWANGGTERRLAPLLKTVEEAVTRYLATPAPAAHNEEQ
jgi:flagellar assembly protein FliH